MMEFHHRALDELRQAQLWYRTKSVQSAERFFGQVSRALDRVLADPASQPAIGRGFHYVRVRKFPFILVYRIRSEGNVFIVAVAHTSRRPGYWNRRK